MPRQRGWLPDLGEWQLEESNFGLYELPLPHALSEAKVSDPLEEEHPASGYGPPDTRVAHENEERTRFVLLSEGASCMRNTVFFETDTFMFLLYVCIHSENIHF